MNAHHLVIADLAEILMEIPNDTKPIACFDAYDLVEFTPQLCDGFVRSDRNRQGGPFWLKGPQRECRDNGGAGGRFPPIRRP
jgi:hypothetical protein